ncbi:RNA polymerase sigma factor [Clostridium sp. UBA5712]|uniref:RNA polymerase sigma factor n=1 Tax=Clostridium sp. UBA5712 TaxID=1946368 RepID=UPI0032167446
MIGFKTWQSKTDYDFSDDPCENFQIYLYYICDMRDSDNKDNMLKHLNLVNPKNCTVPKEEVIRLFNKAYEEYEKCIKLIRSNTIVALKSVNKFKEELKSCDEERAKELKYYLTAIAGVLKTLSEEQQRVVAYRYFEGMTYVNIGKYIECSPGTVRNRIIKTIESIERILFDIYDIHEWSI